MNSVRQATDRSILFAATHGVQTSLRWLLIGSGGIEGLELTIRGAGYREEITL